MSNIFKEHPKIAMKFDMDIMRDVGLQTKVEVPRIQFFVNSSNLFNEATKQALNQRIWIAVGKYKVVHFRCEWWIEGQTKYSIGFIS